MYVSRTLRAAVRQRAENRCEYCHLPWGATSDPFHVDHIISRQHQGPTALYNLALACMHCNNHKGPNLSGIDPRTKRLVELFHPRAHIWSKHLVRKGAFIRGLSAIGRATVAALNMNDLQRLELRLELIAEDILPPNES
jgi:hypothetical protein